MSVFVINAQNPLIYVFQAIHYTIYSNHCIFYRPLLIFQTLTMSSYTDSCHMHFVAFCSFRPSFYFYQRFNSFVFPFFLYQFTNHKFDFVSQHFWPLVDIFDHLFPKF